jgi:hypothetical protein
VGQPCNPEFTSCDHHWIILSARTYHEDKADVVSYTTERTTVRVLYSYSCSINSLGRPEHLVDIRRSAIAPIPVLSASVPIFTITGEDERFRTTTKATSSRLRWRWSGASLRFASHTLCLERIGSDHKAVDRELARPCSLCHISHGRKPSTETRGQRRSSVALA